MGMAAAVVNLHEKDYITLDRLSFDYGLSGWVNSPTLVKAKDCWGLEILNCRRVSRPIPRPHQSFAGVGVFAHRCPGIKVVNNVLWRCRYSIYFCESPGAVVKNNTFYGKSVAHIKLEDGGSCRFTHNILCEDLSFRNSFYWLATYSKPEELVSDYNLYFSAKPELKFLTWQIPGRVFDTLADWRAATGKDLHSVYADPQFKDAKRWDFRLRPDSPARKQGKVLIGSSLSWGSAERKP
jgi:hypothetical protein